MSGYTKCSFHRNFIRKWGTMVEHDEYLKPIITPKYNIGFELTEMCDVKYY